MKRPMFYKLVGKLVVPCGDDVIAWCETLSVGKHVAVDVIGSTAVSTVFLGLDSNWAAFIAGDNDAPPIVFETMIFPTALWNYYQTRCSTWDQAINAQNSAVAHVRKVLRQLPVPV